MAQKKVKIYSLNPFMTYFKNLGETSGTWSEELEKFINEKLEELEKIPTHRKWSFVQIDENFVYFQGLVVGDHPGAVDI